MMPGCKVVRVSDDRIPAGLDWLVIRLDDGRVCAFLKSSVQWCARIGLAIRQAVEALPPLGAPSLAV